MSASTVRRAISRMGTQALPATGRGDVAANQVIKRGHHCAFNASGYVVQFTAATALESAGIALMDVDTTGLADGASSIELDWGVVDLDNGESSDALGRSNMGTPCYAIDNHTVGATSGSSSRSVAGLFLGLNPENGKARVWVGPVGFSSAQALLDTTGYVTQAKSDELSNTGSVHVRGVVDSNVANLAAFAGVTGGTAVNGVTYVAGDIVLLVKQTTAAENGFYIVGAVSGGAAPLTRPSWWAHGATIPQGFVAEVGIEDTAYPGSTWKALCATATKVVDTDDPVFYPRVVKGVATLVLGVKALGSAAKLWVKSTTATVFHVTRNTANTTTATTGGYAVPVSTRTAGVIGTAAATITAQAADGTTNTADVSTVDWSATNW